MLEHAQCFRYRAPEKRRVYEPRERITVGSLFGGLLTIGSNDLSEELGIDVVYLVEKDPILRAAAQARDPKLTVFAGVIAFRDDPRCGRVKSPRLHGIPSSSSSARVAPRQL